MEYFFSCLRRQNLALFRVSQWWKWPWSTWGGSVLGGKSSYFQWPSSSSPQCAKMWRGGCPIDTWWSFARVPRSCLSATFGWFLSAGHSCLINPCRYDRDLEIHAQYHANFQHCGYVDCIDHWQKLAASGTSQTWKDWFDSCWFHTSPCRWEGWARAPTAVDLHHLVTLAAESSRHCQRSLLRSKTASAHRIGCGRSHPKRALLQEQHVPLWWLRSDGCQSQKKSLPPQPPALPLT